MRLRPDFAGTAYRKLLAIYAFDYRLVHAANTA